MEMAKVKQNAILEGLRGRVGNLVFRQYGDQTVVSAMPVHNPQREPTPGEAAQQARIKEAAVRAKLVLADEAGQAYYETARRRLEKRSAYHTAIHDYFGGPEVLAVRWQEGELIIQVRDNVGVRAVRVQVGEESGLAELLEDEPCGLWGYALSGAGPWVVRVEAEDGMGNVGAQEGELKRE
jgi:hypothetical protein